MIPGWPARVRLPRRRRRPRADRKALSVIELVVVLTIIGVALGILIPALQWARNAARETVCQNNMRQISLGLEQLCRGREEFPKEVRTDFRFWPNEACGWTVAILPYTQPAYTDHIYYRKPLGEINVGKVRPPLYRCPNGLDTKSKWGVESLHYFIMLDHKGKNWYVSDAPVDVAIPWTQGINLWDDNLLLTEILQGVDVNAGPHRGGFYRYHRNGNLKFHQANPDWPLAEKEPSVSNKVIAASKPNRGLTLRSN